MSNSPISEEIPPDSWQAKLHCLQRVSSFLALAHTAEEVAALVMDRVLPLFGAQRGLFYLLSEDGSYLRNIRMAGYDSLETEFWKKIPLSLPTPLTDAVRTLAPIALDSEEEKVARYPFSLNIRSPHESPSLVALPLHLGGRSLGVIGISFPTARTFTPENIAFQQSIADQCAIALDKVLLYAREYQARQKAEAEQEKLREVLLSLYASEERYRNLVERSSDAILVHHDFKIVYANPAALALLRARNVGELGNQSILDYVLPQYRDAAEQRILALYNREKPSQPLMVQKWAALDGAIFDLEVTGMFCTWQGHPSVEVILRAL